MPVLRTAAANQPRLENLGDGGPRLLVEDEVTNLLTDPPPGDWILSNLPTIGGQPDPAGGTDGVRLDGSGSGSARRNITIPGATGNAYTFSAYLLREEEADDDLLVSLFTSSPFAYADLYINPETGEHTEDVNGTGSVGVQALGDWWRVWVTLEVPSDDVSLWFVPAPGALNTVSHLQLEAGAYPRSWTPEGTRAADDVVIPAAQVRGDFALPWRFAVVPRFDSGGAVFQNFLAIGSAEDGLSLYAQSASFVVARWSGGIAVGVESIAASFVTGARIVVTVDPVQEIVRLEGFATGNGEYSVAQLAVSGDVYVGRRWDGSGRVPAAAPPADPRHTAGDPADTGRLHSSARASPAPFGATPCREQTEFPSTASWFRSSRGSTESPADARARRRTPGP